MMRIGLGSMRGSNIGSNCRVLNQAANPKKRSHLKLTDGLQWTAIPTRSRFV